MQLMAAYERAPLRFPWLALALSVACVGMAQPVRAYSSFGDYVRPIQEGGGGGRVFTGTPADAYGCEVCHRGAEAAKLDVVGLPEAGYVPGQQYEIRLQWPAATPHVALMAEFTDASGLPSGTTGLAPYATWSAGELCEKSGFPAADLCRVGDTDSGCCRDLEPNRDACSFPGARSVLWMLDCGSRFARVVWTAPPPGSGDVWFSSGMVTSDVNNNALGDGVTLVRKRLRVTGMAPELSSAVGSCQAVSGPLSRSPLAAWLYIALAHLRWRYRARARYEARSSRQRQTPQ